MKSFCFFLVSIAVIAALAYAVVLPAWERRQREGYQTAEFCLPEEQYLCGCKGSACSLFENEGINGCTLCVQLGTWCVYDPSDPEGTCTFVSARTH